MTFLLAISALPAQGGIGSRGAVHSFDMEVEVEAKPDPRLGPQPGRSGSGGGSGASPRGFVIDARKQAAAAAAHLERGLKAFREGDAHGALALFQRALEFAPLDPNAQFSTARVLSLLGRSTEAAEQFVALERRHPRIASTIGAYRAENSAMASPERDTNTGPKRPQWLPSVPDATYWRRFLPQDLQELARGARSAAEYRRGALKVLEVDVAHLQASGNDVSGAGDGDRGDARGGAVAESARTAAAIVGNLQRYGVAVLRNAVPHADCCRMRANLMGGASSSTGTGKGAHEDDVSCAAALESDDDDTGTNKRAASASWDLKNAYVRGAKHRRHVLLSLEQAVGAKGGGALARVARLLRPSLLQLLATKGGGSGGNAGASYRLAELAAVIVKPGAEAQPRHVDTYPDFERVASGRDVLGAEPLVVSAFLSLSDTHEDMGPLEVWPGSHLNHFAYDSVLTDYDKILGVRVAPVPAGTVVVYVSRLVHRGSANTGLRTRPNAMFSVLEQRAGTVAPHMLYALLPQYGNTSVGYNVTLSTLCGEVAL